MSPVQVLYERMRETVRELTDFIQSPKFLVAFLIYLMFKGLFDED